MVYTCATSKAGTSLRTYVDGALVPDRDFSYHVSMQYSGRNGAFPRPSRLGKAFQGFNLDQDVFVGGKLQRGQGQGQGGTSSFGGKLAAVMVATAALSAANWDSEKHTPG